MDKNEWFKQTMANATDKNSIVLFYNNNEHSVSIKFTGDYNYSNYNEVFEELLQVLEKFKQ